MPSLVKTIEQQIRLVFQSPNKVKQTILLPIKIFGQYKQGVAYSAVVVEDEFDREHGTETSRRVHVTDLEIRDANWIHAQPYFPTPSRLLADIFEGLHLPFEKLTFVDLGSGKGRVLLMASQFPFRKIIGAELSAELVEITRTNISAYQGKQECHDIETVCGDFTTFKFPQEPLFVFLYNPASLQLSQKLASNLLHSIEEHPREVWILYVTPYGVFDDVENLETVKTGEYKQGNHPYCLYRTRL